MPFNTMARSISVSSYHLSLIMNIFIIALLLLLPYAKPLSFNFTSFTPNMQNIDFEGDAFSSNNVLQLTKNDATADNLTGSVGRASYSRPVQLWDASSKRLTDFTTHFSFVLRATNLIEYGDGLSFFISPFESKIPPNSSGGYLALFNSNSTSNSPKDNIVAVEFDSFQNAWDPSDNHVGININSIVSVASVGWRSSMKNGTRANAWVTYNSTTRNLSVFLTYADKPVWSGNSSLSHVVDLRNILPEWVRIGFSASTGRKFEIHNILTWSFDSTLETGGRKKKKNLGQIFLG